MLVGSNTNSQYLCNCDPQLPPKAKESEKMLMIQRWINNLPMPHIVEFINKKCEQQETKEETAQKICHCGSLCPQSPPSYDEPENVPPPGKIFSARAPFTAEDHKNFTSSGSAQQVQQKILSHHNILKQYYCNHQTSNDDNGKATNSIYPTKSFKYSTAFTAANNQNGSTANGNSNASHQEQNGRYSSQKRVSCSRASPSPPSRKYQKVGNKRIQKEEENPSQVQCQNLSNSQLLAQLSDSQQTSKDSRHFTLAETNLVVELFEDYFNYPGELPSLAEVRNRIGPTFLIQTRSAVSIRAKIKRLYSSGSWTKFKKS